MQRGPDGRGAWRDQGRRGAREKEEESTKRKVKKTRKNNGCGTKMTVKSHKTVDPFFGLSSNSPPGPLVWVWCWCVVLVSWATKLAMRG